MYKGLFLLIFFGSIKICGSAQVFMTRTGFVSFFSTTTLEDIKAENKQALALIDTDKKQIAFTLLLKSFTFKKDLMQTHFNENYVESDKFPKATFSGTYTEARLNDNNVKVTGNLTLHGVTKYMEMPAKMQMTGDKMTAVTAFTIKPQDFNIAIPTLVRNNIAKDILVDVKIECTPKK